MELTRFYIELVIVTTVLSLGAVPFVYESALAAQVDNRSILLGTSAASANTDHTFNFDYISSSAIGSVEFEYCSNDPFPGQPCTAPVGLDVSGATLDSQTGETGFSIHGSTTTNRLVLTRTPAATTPGPAEYLFGGVINPSTPSQTSYVRIGTFATDDGTGSRTDEGGLAFTIVGGLGLSAYNPPFLEFCVGKVITGHDCSTATSGLVGFGNFAPNSTSFGTSQMTGATNDGNGYIIAVTGTTMTSGNNEIDAMNTAGSSVKGNSQFGFNLRDNSSPNVGSDPSGPGIAAPTANYNSVNQYKFSSGDIVASSSDTSDYRTFTASYIVNIDPDQAAGVYSTTLTYTAIATF